MPRLSTIRDEIFLHHHKRPYQPFALIMENGSRIIIEHPENIAYDPTPEGRDFISVLSANLRYSGPMSAVTSIALLDRGELPE